MKEPPQRQGESPRDCERAPKATGTSTSSTLTGTANTPHRRRESGEPLGNTEGKSKTGRSRSTPTPEGRTGRIIRGNKESNDRKPSFTGSSNAETEMVVHVYEGTKAEGTNLHGGDPKGTGGAWKAGAVSTELAGRGPHLHGCCDRGQPSLGNPEGKSNTVTFIVNNEPPTVTLNEVAKLSKNRQPVFAGYSNVSTEIVIHVYEGESATGTEVAKATAKGDSGDWTAGAVSPELLTGDHTYTADRDGGQPAREPRRQEQPAHVHGGHRTAEGRIDRAVAPESNDRKPAFTGSSNAETEVVVHIYEGTSEVAKATAKGTGGAWKAGARVPRTPRRRPQLHGCGHRGQPAWEPRRQEQHGVLHGQHRTAEGRTQPSIRGTRIERQDPVLQGDRECLHRSRGPCLERKAPPKSRKPAQPATGGAWSTGPVTPELPAGKHSYTAVASQTSPIGNGEGKSTAVPFIVNTEPPKVELKEESVAKRSNNRKPVFSGTSNTPEPEVVVHIFEGATEVAKTTAKVIEGSWKTAALSPELPTREPLLHCDRDAGRACSKIRKGRARRSRSSWTPNRPK